MNKPVYLGLSVVDISKIMVYQYQYNYVKSKYGGNARLCYTDSESFIVHVKSEDVHADLGGDGDTRFDESNYEFQRLLPKTKKVMGQLKDKFGGRIMKEFIAEICSYLIDDGYVNKKANRTKKCIIKCEIKF